MKFKITDMSEGHIDSIAALEKQCFSMPWSKNSLINELNNVNSHFLVAIDESEKVLGYIGFNYVCDEGYITNVAVFPNYRRCGVAKTLLKYIFDFGYKKNLKFVSLEVRQSNLSAICLYKSLDFVNVGLRKNFYSLPKEDAIIMTKYLRKGE